MVIVAVAYSVVICIPRSVFSIHSWLSSVHRCCSFHHEFSVAPLNLNSPPHNVSISLYATSATDRLLVFQVLPKSIGGWVYRCCWSGVQKDRDGGIQFAPDEEDCFPECSHPEVGQHPRPSSIEHQPMSIFTGCNISMGFVLHYQDSQLSHEVRILKFHILWFW